MAEQGVALCPTLAAGEAIVAVPRLEAGRGPRAAGHHAEDARASRRRSTAGVTICNGSDVGVFTHGDNARELELHGRLRHDARGALRAATSIDAKHACTWTIASAR